MNHHEEAKNILVSLMPELPYFPLNHDSEPFSMGVKVLAPTEPLLETTERYADEIRLKRRLLNERPDVYAAVPHATQAAQQETFDYLLPRCTAIKQSQNSTESFQNLLLKESVTSSDSPLMTLARHLQEDLVLLDASQPFLPIVAGVVCFPSGWSIAEKLGMPLSSVHAPVPDFQNRFGAATQRLLHLLKPNRPVWRMNWGVRASAELDQSPERSEAIQLAAKQLTREASTDLSVIGDRCYLRIERQTLSKLPLSNSILFTIHTYQTNLAKLSGEQRRVLHHAINRCSLELLTYKAITVFSRPLQQYLEMVD